MKAILVFYGGIIFIGIILLFMIGINPFSIALAILGGLGAMTTDPQKGGEQIGKGVGMGAFGITKGLLWDAPVQITNDRINRKR